MPPPFLSMPALPRHRKSLLAPLGVSVLLHGLILSASIAPMTGGSAPYPPDSVRLSVRLIPLAAPSPVPATVEAVEPAPTPQPSPSVEQATTDGAAGPSGWVESPLSAPYLEPWEVDAQARPIDPPPLVLPEAVLREHIHGRVELKVFLSDGGRVDDVELIYSSHPGKLEDAAIEAIRATGFSPARRSGVAVRSAKRIQVVFDPHEDTDLPAHSEGANPEAAP